MLSYWNELDTYTQSYSYKKRIHKNTAGTFFVNNGTNRPSHQTQVSGTSSQLRPVRRAACHRAYVVVRSTCALAALLFHQHAPRIDPTEHKVSERTIETLGDQLELIITNII